jgi:hypothetical protein
MHSGESPTMTPHDFIRKWQPIDLSERSACQQHFLDLCEWDEIKQRAEKAWIKVQAEARKAQTRKPDARGPSERACSPRKASAAGRIERR